MRLIVQWFSYIFCLLFSCKSGHSYEEALNLTFKNLSHIVNQDALIESDEHRNYEPVVKRYFPHAVYKQYKSEKGCIAGQGELKKVRHDPIFKIDHTLAMMRDGISTFVRRSWCTTQDPKRLKGHLEIFMYYYNQFYLGGLSPG